MEIQAVEGIYLCLCDLNESRRLDIFPDIFFSLRYCSDAAGRHCLIVREFKATAPSEALSNRGETSESWLWDADFFLS